MVLMKAATCRLEDLAMTVQECGTLTEQIGGEVAIHKLVDGFYERVLADSLLRTFFPNTHVDRLRRAQYKLFMAAFDGIPRPAGRPTRSAAFARGIPKEHFGRFIGLLLESLEELRLRDDTIHRAIGRLIMCG
jgi:hemoglobin